MGVEPAQVLDPQNNPIVLVEKNRFGSVSDQNKKVVGSLVAKVSKGFKSTPILRKDARLSALRQDGGARESTLSSESARRERESDIAHSALILTASRLKRIRQVGSPEAGIAV